LIGLTKTKTKKKKAQNFVWSTKEEKKLRDKSVVLLETCWRTHWEREELDGNSLGTKERKKSISPSPPFPKRKSPEPLGCIASLSEQKFMFLHLFVTIFDLV
jgi:hypothetical protein